MHAQEDVRYIRNGHVDFVENKFTVSSTHSTAIVPLLLYHQPVAWHTLLSALLDWVLDHTLRASIGQTTSDLDMATSNARNSMYP